MNKKIKVIVSAVSCIALVLGALSVNKIKNNKYERNAEVSLEMPSTDINKSNVELEKTKDETVVKSEIKSDIKSDDKVENTPVKKTKDNNEDINITTNKEVVEDVVYENNNTVEDNSVQVTPPTSNIPPVADEKPPINPTPPVTPPPVVETPEIPEVTFPTVEEMKQFMINYGVGLGKNYDPNLDGNGIKRYYYTETWSPWIGQEGGANQLFGGFQYNTFGITVIDQGNGWVEFAIYVSEDEYFG